MGAFGATLGSITHEGGVTMRTTATTQRRSRPRHHWPVCESTGKLRLRERKDVRLALAAAEQARSLAHLRDGECSWTVVRGYRCAHCGGWHLTSLRTWSDPAPSA